MNSKEPGRLHEGQDKMGGNGDLPLVHEAENELEHLLREVGYKNDGVTCTLVSHHALGQENVAKVSGASGQHQSVSLQNNQQDFTNSHK